MLSGNGLKLHIINERLSLLLAIFVLFNICITRESTTFAFTFGTEFDSVERAKCQRDHVLYPHFFKSKITIFKFDTCEETIYTT